MDQNLPVKGGEFLVKETSPESIFIPEELNEEQRMIGQTCQGFLDTEVFPYLERIDAHEEGLMRELLSKTGELGLLAISIPEEFGGFGQSFLTSMYASEVLGAGYSYAVAHFHVIPGSVHCRSFIMAMKNRNRNIFQNWLPAN